MTLPFPEIGNRSIALWWILRNMGSDAALDIALMANDYPPMTAEQEARALELVNYFDEAVKKVEDDRCGQ